ncbi:MAG: L-aspartate oxidase [Candidatus Krumholzibacteria bacterium]|nr:L-aspartate oxidase [Candidatus Krumholzibacteria bacterium]
MDDTVVSRCLVVGSGIAGLQFALHAAESGTVRVVTKKESRESNTNYAQGGIAAAVSPLDDFETHVRDTLLAGDGLCDEEVVRRMVEAGPDLIDRLLSYGIQFSREGKDKDAAFALGREGGHSRRRVLHCRDLTGHEIESRLLEACARHPNITMDEDHMGLELLKGDVLGWTDDNSGRVVGCLILDRRTLNRQAYFADAVVLATGGCGKVYSYTSNPDIATGDGLAMAYRAGAEVRNLEFVQFHPTCLYHADAKSFLISEAVRGEGAHLINGRGEKFMSRYHHMGDLAPRDVVARSIDREMKTSGDASVFLDLRHLDRRKIEERFPNLVKICAGFGIDMAGEPVPVVPAAHYMCGGVAVDLDARTSLPGLYAIGEVACTGVHGANRLASNSLLEAVFFATRAAEAIAGQERILDDNAPVLAPSFGGRNSRNPEGQAMVLEHDWDLVRRVMWDYVGIVRDRERLDIAQDRLRSMRQTVEKVYNASVINPPLVELRNIALLGELIVMCAKARHESRGLHYTLDHPHKLSRAEDTVITRHGFLEGETSWESPGDVRG